LEIDDPKLVQHIIENFDNFEETVDELGGPEKLLEGHQIAFSTMGVGQPSKVTSEEFYKIDVLYLKSFVNICKRSNAVVHMSLLGAVGADSKSWTNYMKFKGEAENAIIDANFGLGCGLFRPSLLVTDEERYGIGQSILQSFFPKISWVLPSNYHEIHVNDLARAMLCHAERKLCLGQHSDDILHYQDFMREIEGGHEENKVGEEKTDQ